MKRSITITITLAGLWIVVLICDFYTTPLTSEAELEAAELYLAKTGLPTPPRAFAHDGCTLYPDSLPFHDFQKACLKHDISYWAGGSTELRKATDEDFYRNLQETGPLGSSLFAPVMYAAVRSFGDSWLSHKLGANWGYGSNTSD
jgi:hypothetical protein